MKIREYKDGLDPKWAGKLSWRLKESQQFGCSMPD